MIYLVKIHNTMFLSLVEAFCMIPEENADDDDPFVRFYIPGMADYVLLARAPEPCPDVIFSTFTSFGSFDGETYSCNGRDKFHDNFLETESKKDLIKILMGAYEKFLYEKRISYTFL